MAVITTKYRSDTARLFVEDVVANDYYLFASSIANTSIENSSISKREFLEKTIFGKKIDNSDVFYVIKNYIWNEGAVYDQYDDQEELGGKKYYAVVYPEDNETGDYKIYKCLSNNYGAKSTNPPNYQLATPDQVYVMPDGYVWKYLYTLTVGEFDKYNTRGFIPIIPDEGSLANTAFDYLSSEDRTIDQIFVENPEANGGYESVVGTIFEVTRGAVNEVTLTPSAAGQLSAIANYYTGYSLYVTNSISSSEVYEIETYSFSAITGRATITLAEGTPEDDVLVDAATFSILPRIKIQGNGTGCVAIPSVSDDGVITSVTIINKGSGYTSATAKIPDPFAFDPTGINTLDERVILRPVLSPPNSHGADLVDELSCTRVLTYVEFTNVDNETLPATNSYSSIGIVKNPEFKDFTYPDLFDNRIELALNTNPFTANETVIQIDTLNADSDFFNDTSFQAKVHEVSGDYIYLAEYSGAFPNGEDGGANTNFSDISLNTSLPLISSQGQLITINTNNDPEYTGDYEDDATYPGFKLSPYIQRTGEIHYMSRFFPINRTASSNEQFKIILEF